jgi:hypothetical protein
MFGNGCIVTWAPCSSTTQNSRSSAGSGGTRTPKGARLDFFLVFIQRRLHDSHFPPLPHEEFLWQHRDVLFGQSR